MDTGPKVVFWDLGGVLLRTEDQAPRRVWEERLGLPINVNDLSQYIGALGAATFALERVKHGGELPPPPRPAGAPQTHGGH